MQLRSVWFVLLPHRQSPPTDQTGRHTPQKTTRYIRSLSAGTKHNSYLAGGQLFLFVWCWGNRHPSSATNLYVIGQRAKGFAKTYDRRNINMRNASSVSPCRLCLGEFRSVFHAAIGDHLLRCGVDLLCVPLRATAGIDQTIYEHNESCRIVSRGAK